MKKKFLLLNIFFILFFFACRERARNNIFDPKTTLDSLDISLRITQSDTLIKLLWTNPQNVDLRAVHIYRKKENDNDFSLLAALPATADSFIDSVDAPGIGYGYFINFLGADNESVPSKKIFTTPGPGTFWILDLWGYNILHYTYDMQHSINSKYAVFVPAAMAFSTADSVGLIAYNYSHYLEIFNISTSQTIAGFDQIKYPFDAIFDDVKRGFWVVDSSGGLYMYSIKDNTLALKSSATTNPVLILNDTDKLWIVDRKQKALLTFDKEGELQAIINHIELISFNDPYFMAIDSKRKNYYFLDHTENEDRLYGFNEPADEIRFLHREKNIKALRYDAFTNTLWLAVNDSLDAKLVQLSTSGIRLKELSGFRFISDFVINPVNGSITVADPGKRQVKQIQSDGNIIGILTKINYPYKVYFQ